MRKLACLLMLVGGMFTMTGCATPAYTGGENLARIGRSMDYDLKQGMEDFNYEMLVVPPSRMTMWNLR